MSKAIGLYYDVNYLNQSIYNQGTKHALTRSLILLNDCIEKFPHKHACFSQNIVIIRGSESLQIMDMNDRR